MENLIKILIVLFLSLTCIGRGCLYAQKQGQPLIDSLLKTLPKAKEDTNKVKLLNRLSGAYNNVNLDEGIKYGLQELALAQKINWKKGEVNAHLVIGYNYRFKSDSFKALEQYTIATKIAQELNDLHILKESYDLIGELYLHEKDYTKSLEYYNKALDAATKQGDKSSIAYEFSNIANVFAREKDSVQEILYRNKAIVISREVKDKTVLYNMLCNMAHCYFMKLDYSETLDYCFMALQVAEDMGSKQKIENQFNEIAKIYEIISNYPKQLEYSMRALDIAREINDSSLILENFIQIANIYKVEQNYNYADTFLHKALDYTKGNNKVFSYAICHFRLAELFEEKKEFERATAEIKIAFRVFDSLGNIQGKTGCYMVLALIAKKQRKYNEALAYCYNSLKIYRNTKDQNNTATCLIVMAECYILIAKNTSCKNFTDSLVPAGKTQILNKALVYLDEGIVLSKKVNKIDNLIEAYEHLSELNMLTGNYRLAYENYKFSKTLKDSIYSQENSVKISRMETNQELSVKDKQIEINNLLLAKKKSETRYYILGLGLLAVVIIMVFRSYVYQMKYNRLLNVEKKKSEDLLHNILPKQVAHELKETGVSDAKLFDNVTVLFTDFVNFTKAAAHMGPQELVNELHTCFKAFDEITGKHNIEKIKTVGDAYLAIAGLPIADPKHAENMVNAAKEIAVFMQDRYAKIGDKSFQVRIGIHSGSVVAGIVGVKKFAFDIWGDTVNIAARMEQNSMAGKINISESTYELVKDKFTFEYRGEIEAKNKGALKMYFVRA